MVYYVQNHIELEIKDMKMMSTLDLIYIVPEGIPDALQCKVDLLNVFFG